MRKLENLEPKKVFYFFEDLCAIPHGSGNTKKISDYCKDFAEKRGLFCIQDEHNNIIIKKDATKGYEDHPAVILQGHLDMVCEKDADCQINFETDGLDIYVDGDYVKARGTTLGGDDGIAVAMALAILDDDTLSHPALEVLFTTDEETGMYGAEGLDASHLSAKQMINIDTEAEGIFTVGCAGGARAELSLPFTLSPLDKSCIRVTVKGLLGGHSGTEINKGRQNSNMVLAKFLSTLPSFRLVSINGGLKDNAITAYSECIVYCEGLTQKTATDFANSIRIDTDGGLEIFVEDAEKQAFAIDEKTSKKAVEFLLALPNGVQTMSADIAGLVETSLNLGILKTEEDKISASFAVRSSVGAEKTKLLTKLENIAKDFGAEYSTCGHYPAWEYRKNSPLRESMLKTYKEFYGGEPVVEIIHAGLECGLFSEKIEGLDTVSIGCNVNYIHTPREQLSISSAERSFLFICKILENL